MREEENIVCQDYAQVGALADSPEAMRTRKLASAAISAPCHTEMVVFGEGIYRGAQT